MNKESVLKFTAKHFFLILIILAFFAPFLAFAQNSTNYSLLAPLPLKSTNKVDTSINAFDYIPGIVRLAIAIAAVLAVLRIIIAGIQYMSTDAWGEKDDAKKSIWEAFEGLGIAIAAWLILYTINPNLVEFKLSLQSVKVEGPPPVTTPGPTPPPTTPTPGRPGAGCSGNCPYTYTKPDGTVISYKDCNNCSDANSYGLDIKFDVVDGKNAQINNELGSKLKALKDSGAPGFRVTETWPPTYNHKNQNQYDGTSVDVNFIGIPTDQAVRIFIDKANQLGFKKVQYEVKTQADKNRLINAGVPPINVIVESRITAPHFSIE